MLVVIVGGISIGVVFLLGCVGEILTEKSGHLNLGIPGIMCMGAAGGCYTTSLYINSLPTADSASWLVLVLVAVLGATITGALGGLIYAVLTVSLRANQNVTGLALTTFGAGFAQFVMDTYVDRTRFSAASKIIRYSIIGNADWGWFGKIFLGHGILVYLAIAIAVTSAIVLKRTRVGLNLRAVGENPATADATGINVTAYKYGAILTGSAIAGLGGVFYILDYIGGSWENASTIEGLGWLAIALVIFTLWKPDLSILGSFLFGMLYIASSGITGVSFNVMKLLKLLPYVVTVIVLIVTSILDSKENQPPASLGLNYFREER
ncbi:MAG: ABC transporter permease [Clostridiales bacterium]|nr:ABC transporter permease [Clostridiales bacterium]